MSSEIFWQFNVIKRQSLSVLNHRAIARWLSNRLLLQKPSAPVPNVWFAPTASLIILGRPGMASSSRPAADAELPCLSLGAIHRPLVQKLSHRQDRNRGGPRTCIGNHCFHRLGVFNGKNRLEGLGYEVRRLRKSGSGRCQILCRRFIGHGFPHGRHGRNRLRPNQDRLGLGQEVHHRKRLHRRLKVHRTNVSRIGAHSRLQKDGINVCRLVTDFGEVPMDRMEWRIVPLTGLMSERFSSRDMLPGLGAAARHSNTKKVCT